MRASFYEREREFSVGECVAVPPKKGEVRLEIAYCGVCGTDVHIFMGTMDSRVGRHRTIGHECSAVVAETGEGVEGFKPGDRVVVRPLDYCGECPTCRAGFCHICQNLKFMGVDSEGAFQGSWTVDARTLHRIPDQISLQDGALIEPLAVACHDVERAEIKRGDKAVVIGGGPIGLLVAIAARSRGADILISEVSEDRLKLAHDLGFDTVNPVTEDAEAAVLKRTDGAGADVAFEVSGSQAGAELMTKIVRPRGRIVVVAIFGKTVAVDLHKFFWREYQMRGARVYEKEDFEKALSLMEEEADDIRRLVTSIYPLSRIQEAFEKIVDGRREMKVLIDCRKEVL